MTWRVLWYDEERAPHERRFYYSTAATHFVCELLEADPEQDIIFESLADDEVEPE